MQKIDRLLTNICTQKLQESKQFYCSLFELNVGFESDWFIQLTTQDNQHEFALIDQHHELVPESFQQAPTGIYITFVVNDVDVLHQLAIEQNYKVVEPPVNTFYGQRRLLLEDPNGLLIDLSAPIEGFQM